MDVAAMLAHAHNDTSLPDGRRSAYQNGTRNLNATNDISSFARPYAVAASASRSLRSADAPNADAPTSQTSPAKREKKRVVFQLIDPQDPRIHARLPMRVKISDSDTAESIITTIKNFYGLYDFGISFEDKDGIGMVAAYDNFEQDMIVYVRTIPLPRVVAAAAEHARDSASPKRPTLGAPIDLRHTASARSPSRAAARSAGARSQSPTSEAGRRSMSAVPGSKPWPQRTKSKDNVYGELDGYSSGDNAEGSVASSRRSKAEVVNAEISVDNIVEGGRRKRAFESSELPLFVPPQVPMTTSISSVSPQRRAAPPHNASPYAYSNQQTFSYQHPLPSPQSFGGSSHQLQSSVASATYCTPYPPPTRQMRTRSYQPPRYSNGGILPTPDPTVGSAISDEDVALQLMRLGDPTAFSHGRTSTSTADDALSGKAEAASSDDEEPVEDEVNGHPAALPSTSRATKVDSGPARKKQRVMNELPSDVTSGDEYEDHRDATFNGGGEVDARKKAKPSKQRASTGAPKAASRPRVNSIKPKSKSLGSSVNGNAVPQMTTSKGLVSPTSMPAPSRKGSVSSTTTPLNFQHALGADEEDLSSKPRCQRCRKSKKGCDRQRPCGRCKDAGIGIDGCVSEEEGNGRKGRYGRHMGVPIKKGDDPMVGVSPAEHIHAHSHPHPHTHAPVTAANGAASAATPYPIGATFAANDVAGMMNGSANGFVAPALPDKNKKRKR